MQVIPKRVLWPKFLAGFRNGASLLLNGSPSLPGSHRALAKFSFPVETAICNLDDPAQLIELALRPSQVVAREYRTSQDWALAIFERQRWNGVK